MSITHDGFLVNARTFLDDVAPELAGILADPASDDERLIYADWLEERGRHHTARFIRRQIAGEVAMVPLLDTVRVVQPMEIGGLGRRTAEPGVCEWRRNGGSERVVWRRGFIAEVHAPLAVLQQHLPALVRQHPIERVRATDKEPEAFDENGETPTSSPPVEFVWWWTGGSETESRYHLPGPVYHMLEGYFGTSIINVDRDYPTAEAAHEALSVALLKLARE